MAFSILALVNVWVVLSAIGGYQLFLQLRGKSQKAYPEGFLRPLQYLTGIPALGSLALFLLDPDSLGFVFLQMPMSVNVIGLVLFNAAAFSIGWSHFTLGRFWSGELETRSDHQLVDSGPYALVRHPLYSSYFLLTLGFFLATANWFVGALMLLYFLTIAARSGREERMLRECLGMIYILYCERTPRFFPFAQTR